MRPLTVLIGIVMGSTVSMTVGLAMTLAVFLLMPDQAERVGEELWPLTRSFGFMLGLAAVASLSFYGELRDRRWRAAAHAALLVGLGLAVWMYYPRR